MMRDQTPMSLSGVARGLILIAGVISICALVSAAGPVDLAINTTSTMPWNETGIMPGYSNSSFTDLYNSGTLDGTLYIWLDDIQETDPHGNGTALGTYLQLNVSHPRLATTVPLPASVYSFPTAPLLPASITVYPFHAGETIRLRWTWEFRETGRPQNDAQNASLRFNISYTLVNVPPPPPPPPGPGGDTGGGVGERTPTPVLPVTPPLQVPTPPGSLLKPLVPYSGLSLTQPVIEGLQGITVTKCYDMGFPGLAYNLNGSEKLYIDTALVPAAPAHVTQYADRVEVYQYSTNGVLMVFYGENFEMNGTVITGNATGATFTTDPLVVGVSSGTVAGSVEGDLVSVITRGWLCKTISGNVSRDSVERFMAVSTQNNLSFGGIGCVMTIDKESAIRSGAANVTFAVPASWVRDHGGTGAIHIGRINETTGVAELLPTSAIGPDAVGTMVFRGESKNGTSLFGLVVASAGPSGQGLPVVTYEAPRRGPIFGGTSLWILILVLLLLGAAGAAAYFWSQRREN